MSELEFTVTCVDVKYALAVCSLQGTVLCLALRLLLADAELSVLAGKDTSSQGV